MTSLRVLTVCTGNICRSPLTASVLRKHFDAAGRSDIETSSAGTSARVGEFATLETEKIAGKWDIPILHTQSQQMTPRILRSHDLIIGLTKTHRQSIIEMNPLVMRRTFTLSELHNLLIDPTRFDSWPATLAELGRGRALMGFAGGHTDDVVDPYGRSEEIYADMAQQIIPRAVDIANFIASIGANNGNR